LIEKPFVSVVTPTFNEVGNITELYERIVRVLEAEELPFEIIVIDNDSSDGTQALLRTIAKADVRFKVIFNESNYGHIKSPYHALLQASGDVAIF
jgi:glycosyltransferase involved in cell wall biosynthesis